MPNWFNDRKTAQIAAFYCQSEGGSIDVLKLVKLIYLADRESMNLSGFPITNDRLVSMPHGPVNSMALNFIDGNVQSDNWSELISDRANYCVGLTRELTDADNDELSEFDMEVLNLVWKNFGSMTKWEIRDWTHDNCPEWENPNGSCNPIPHERVLKYLGNDHALEFASDIADERNIDSIFEALRA